MLSSKECKVVLSPLKMVRFNETANIAGSTRSRSTTRVRKTVEKTQSSAGPSRSRTTTRVRQPVASNLHRESLTKSNDSRKRGRSTVRSDTRDKHRESSTDSDRSRRRYRSSGREKYRSRRDYSSSSVSSDDYYRSRHSKGRGRRGHRSHRRGRHYERSPSYSSDSSYGYRSRSRSRGHRSHRCYSPSVSPPPPSNRKPTAMKRNMPTATITSSALSPAPLKRTMQRAKSIADGPSPAPARRTNQRAMTVVDRDLSTPPTTNQTKQATSVSGIYNFFIFIFFMKAFRMVSVDTNLYFSKKFIENSGCCSHHAVAKKKPTLPWAVPNLLPIDRSSSSGIQRNDSSTSGLQQSNRVNALTDHEQTEHFQTQVKMNTKMMEELQSLREEKQLLLKRVDQGDKEKQAMKIKLGQMNEQLQYLKKKANKSQVEADENIDPNIEKANKDNKSGENAESGNGNGVENAKEAGGLTN